MGGEDSSGQIPVAPSAGQQGLGAMIFQWSCLFLALLMMFWGGRFINAPFSTNGLGVSPQFEVGVICLLIGLGLLAHAGHDEKHFRILYYLSAVVLALIAAGYNFYTYPPFRDGMYFGRNPRYWPAGLSYHVLAESLIVYLAYKAFSWKWVGQRSRLGEIAFISSFIVCVIIVYKSLEYFDTLLYTEQSPFAILAGAASLGAICAFWASRYRVALLSALHAWLAFAMMAAMLFLYTA